MTNTSVAAARLPLLRVRTNHSEYLIDQNKGRFSRRPVHEMATDLSPWGIEAGEWTDYLEVYSGVEVGQPLIIITAGGFVRSTLVQTLEEVETDVAQDAG